MKIKPQSDAEIFEVLKKIETATPHNFMELYKERVTILIALRELLTFRKVLREVANRERYDEAEGEG